MHSSVVCANQIKVRGIPFSLSAECLRSKERLGDSIALTPLHVPTRSKQNIWKVEARLGIKIPEILTSKLRFGARIVREGGVQKIFTRLFSVQQGERLLKVCQCSLSTTAGPIPGFLFISTHKSAFCSEKSIAIPSPTKGSIKIHYKVSIPVEKTERVNEYCDVNKKSRKYIQVVTVDGFEFWFMGLSNYQKVVKYLQHVVSRGMANLR